MSKYYMSNTELTLKLGIIAISAYILSHLVYRLALEVWCIAYGLIMTDSLIEFEK